MPYDFYPRSPCGERHAKIAAVNAHCYISIHALLAESDGRRGAVICYLDKLISIHALLAESDWLYIKQRDLEFPISIHALLAESDHWSGFPVVGRSISIHALLAESDVMDTLILANAMLFLSTLSLRRATAHNPRSRKQLHPFLSTLSLRRATPTQTKQTEVHTIFLSTLSLRRATVGQKRFLQKLAISIHALLAESDKTHRQSPCQNRDFYPRSPCGERPHTS